MDACLDYIFSGQSLPQWLRPLAAFVVGFKVIVIVLL